MFRTEHHSNLVILADGLKACIVSIHTNAMMAESEAEAVVNGTNTTMTEQMRPIFYKSQQRYSELNFLMYAAFFLEAYINMYDYSLNSAIPTYDFEKFSKLPTSQKWKSHFETEANFLAQVRDLFDFRNFLVHSKPIRRQGSKNEVYVKGKGWISAMEVSSLMTNDLGLAQDNIPVEKLTMIHDLINNSVDLIEQKSKGFNLHYNLKLNSIDQFDLIQKANVCYHDLGKKLNAK